jgi:hypothetical protein
VSGGDIWPGLPDLQWAGLPTVPSAVLTFGWKHSLAERRAPYIDAAWHDATGRDPMQFRARLYFDAGLQFNAFPELWNKWRPKLLVGTIDNLRHPIIGLIRARVASVDGDTAPTNRSGFVIDVAWVESLDDPEDQRELPDVSLVGQAVAAENAARAVNVTWPDGSYEPSLEEAIKQVESAAFGAVASVSAYASKVAGTVSVMIESVSRLTDPLAHPAFDGLIAVHARVTEIAANAERAARQTARKQITNDIGLDEFADSVGNTLAEAMQLNPLAVRDPIVRAPATLVYYV